MKTIPEAELHERLIAVQGKLSHLKTQTSHRRLTWQYDFHAVGDPFVRDFSVIQSSKAWRRMSGKNQVASSPFVPHIRNRATHSSEVIAHSVRIADYLGLNSNLAQAIAAGHDIGHVPLGHHGEYYLRKKMGKSFTHEMMGVIVAQHIERCGEGLNLTHATLDGMYRHSGKNATPTMTPEAWVVRYADKIAYLFADYNDFKRMKWCCPSELDQAMNWFGNSQRHRTFYTILALCEESSQTGKVTFEQSEEAVHFAELRALMYKEYVRVVEQDVSRFLDPIWTMLERSNRIPPWLGIALLTDEEVFRFVGDGRLVSWRGIMDTGMGEIVGSLTTDHMFKIDPLNLDLDW